MSKEIDDLVECLKDIMDGLEAYIREDESMSEKLDEWNRQERANNHIYQFFVKMDNEKLLEWLNSVTTTVEHQDQFDIITNWILAERGYEAVLVPGVHWTERYKLEKVDREA